MDKKRSSNFELLRIVAMLGIVMFHHFGVKYPNYFVELTGGFTLEDYFYDFITNTGAKVSILSVLLDFCYAHFGEGGNLIFMLLTGYYIFDKEYSFSRRINKAKDIFLTIVFYGFIFLFYYFAFFKTIFTLPQWLCGDNLWYLQCYGVFIIVILPLLKLIEPKLSKTMHLNISLGLVSLQFFAWNIYLPNFWISDQLLKFIMCYYIGGYIAKYKINPNWKKIIGLSISYLVFYFIYEYCWRYFNFTTREPNEYAFTSAGGAFIYCLIYAVLMLLIFQKITFQSNIINIVSSTTIGVYTFHYVIMEYNYTIANQYWWHDWSLLGYCKFVVIDTFLLFIIALLLDLLRQFIFKKLNNLFKFKWGGYKCSWKKCCWCS